MKIFFVGAGLLYAGGRKDRRDETNGRFSQFCERVWKEEKSAEKKDEKAGKEEKESEERWVDGRKVRRTEGRKYNAIKTSLGEEKQYLCWK